MSGASKRPRIEKIGPFKVLREIGQGGTSLVFLAKSPEGETVAVKLFATWVAPDEQSRARFLREIRQVREFHHPRLVRILGAGSVEKIPYFAMEYLSGPTLEAYLEANGRLELPEFFRILEETLEGLEVLHQRQVVHRDLKPANIFLDGPARRVKLGDFGLAKGVQDLDLTMANERVGTPAYMSPEQCKGTGVSPASDVYQMGVLAYQLWTGKVPFEAPNFFKMSMMHLATQARPLEESREGTPPGIQDWVGRALEKRPKRRFEDASRMLESLRELRNQLARQGHLG